MDALIVYKAQPQQDEEGDQLRGEEDKQDHNQGDEEEGEGGECWCFHSLLSGSINLLLHSSTTKGGR